MSEFVRSIQRSDLVIGIGVVFLIVGFALIIPSGSVPGSYAIRNVKLGSSHIVKTPGFGERPARRRRMWTVVIGVAFFGLGLLFIALGS